jgi:hypothetical protein
LSKEHGMMPGPWQREADVLRHEQETSDMFEQAGEKLRALEDLHHSLTERDQVSDIKSEIQKYTSARLI